MKWWHIHVSLPPCWHQQNEVDNLELSSDIMQCSVVFNRINCGQINLLYKHFFIKSLFHLKKKSPLRFKTPFMRESWPNVKSVHFINHDSFIMSWFELLGCFSSVPTNDPNAGFSCNGADNVSHLWHSMLLS